MLGLRTYLGKRGKSLIRRHREDDPSFSGVQIVEMWAAIQAAGGLDTIIEEAKAFHGSK